MIQLSILFCIFAPLQKDCDEHNWEALRYSASVNLDNSLCSRIEKTPTLG